MFWGSRSERPSVVRWHLENQLKFSFVLSLKCFVTASFTLSLQKVFMVPCLDIPFQRVLIISSSITDLLGCHVLDLCCLNSVLTIKSGLFRSQLQFSFAVYKSLHLSFHGVFEWLRRRGVHVFETWDSYSRHDFEPADSSDGMTVLHFVLSLYEFANWLVIRCLSASSW